MVSARCYYEVLDIPRTSNQDEIRRAYKKKALQLHPDKNSHRLEEATREFAYLQQCYGVLNDSSERRWYDQHREQILRAAERKTMDEHEFIQVADLMHYFSPSSAYKGYSDSSNGFFTIYRNLFQQMEFYENKLAKKLKKSTDKFVSTSFGDSKTPFIPGVKTFYDKWIHFSTLRAFVETDDTYSRSSGESRDHRRYLEKEAKKERDERRKEYNTTIRSLALFIKKRDPRYQHWLRLETEKKASMANIKSRPRKDNSTTINNVPNDFWKTSEEQEAYEAYFTMYANDYMDEDDYEHLDTKYSEPIEELVQHCVACKKSFKSDSQWNNHEKSKKHQKNLFILKKKMLMDENKWKLYLQQTKSKTFDDESDLENYFSEDETTSTNSCISSERNNSSDLNEDTFFENETIPLDYDSNQANEDYSLIESDISLNDHDTYFKEDQLEPDNLNLDYIKLTSSSSSDENDNWNIGRQALTQKRPNSSQKSGIEIKANTSAGKQKLKSPPEVCKFCKSKFPSRNSLFNHLKQTGHQSFK